MFVQSTSDLERPYPRLRLALLDGASWLAPLALPALIEVLEQTNKLPIAADHADRLTRLRAGFRCQIGPIRLHLDTITVPTRWLSDLDPVIFPPLLDADLHLAGIGPTHSQLTLYGNYPRPTAPAEPDANHQTVQAVIDTYLRAVTTTLKDQTT
jgi:hypothetical protein